MSYEYKEIFLEEAEEQLEVLNNALLALEDDKDNMEHLHSIFRVTHTLKSSAAFVGLNDLADFAHKVESLLQLILDDKVEPTTEVVDLLFESFDNIKLYIGRFAKDEAPDIDFSDLKNRAVGIIQNAPGKSNSGSIQTEKTVAAKNEEEEIIEVDVPLDFTAEELEGIYREGIQKFSTSCDDLTNAYQSGKAVYYINIFLEEDIKMKWVRGELILVSLERLGTICSSVPRADNLKSPEFERNLEILFITSESEEEIRRACDVDQVMFVFLKKVGKGDMGIGNTVTETAALSQTENETESRSEENADFSFTEEDAAHEMTEEIYKDKKMSKSQVSSSSLLSQSQSVRVPIEKLDSLLNLVGELAIVNSGFIEIQDRFRNILGSKNIVGDLKDKIESLSNIAKALQEGIMQSRMVPVGFVFSRFHRLVRDLSNSLKKKVNLVIRGEDTELDKKIIDAIGEPLIHLVRNSIDHGMESEQERTKKGKTPVGTIELNAFQRGNHIIIEVTDDGKGLNRDSITKKAVEIGLIDEQSAKTLDDQSVYGLIFEPGFSTKTEVTDLSGRGMGMNIVKETVEQLNGNVSIATIINEGTTFSLAFPLTMAILPAILCTVGDEVFAIPLYNVYETLKVRKNEIETIDFKEVLRVRNEVIELCRLSELIEGAVKSSSADDKIPVVVVEYDNLRIGIIVDELLGKREIVTKSISHYFKEKEMDGISGATILGNGKIALILDILSLIKRFKIESGMKRSGKYDRKSNGKNSKMEEFMYDEENEKQILNKIGITETEFHSISELYKIGVSNAGKNLSKFLMTNVIISAPLIRIHRIEEYQKHSFYFQPGYFYICEMELTDGAGGKFILVLDDQSIRQLFEPFLGNDPDMGSEIVSSAIAEATNILGAGVTNTLSNALKMSIYISTPTIYHMTLDEYFGRFLSEYKIKNEYIWAILASIILDKKTLEGKVYILPDENTFFKMKDAIGKDKELLAFIENVMV